MRFCSEFSKNIPERSIMANEGKTPVCLQCGATSSENVLIKCIRDEEDTWVCVSCLPILIHGGH